MNTDLYSSTLRQLNAKIIPFIIICYFVANLDKTNISIAALQMNADLGLSASMYGLGVGMFYISYIIFEIPSNVIMTKVGARLWIAGIMITGALSVPGCRWYTHPRNSMLCDSYSAWQKPGLRRASFIIFPAGFRKATARVPCHSFIWDR